MPQFIHNQHNLLEGNSDFHQSHQNDRDFRIHDYGNSGLDLGGAILLNAGYRRNSLEPPSQSGSPDPGSGTGPTTYPSLTSLSSINTGVTRGGGWENWLAWVNHISPFQSNGPSNYGYQVQRASPQATGYPISQTGSYLGLSLNNPQFSITQEQPPSGVQSQEFYPNLGNGNRVPSPLPAPSSSACRARKRGIVADCSSPGPHTCHMCGIKCWRPADLNRHLKTAGVHGDPDGPVCPEPGCRYTKRFSRLDNFKAHYKRLRRKSNNEADMFIQQWKARGGT
ncbi:hypothetical protein HOY80DRAFT_1084169 [Tuber brumale]|nr:hypothetical protein HOY80DRAFT_1084169 [Tuber brumale]